MVIRTRLLVLLPLCAESFSEVSEKWIGLFICADQGPPSEHLGLLPPQWCRDPYEEPSSFMRPAPHPNPDETDDREDTRVADPLSDTTLNLWNDTARKNREIFTEVFRPVPTNLVRDWTQYDVRLWFAGFCLRGTY
jgi:hypothetical protein